MEVRKIPTFATEADEAQWWYDHREELADDMIAAAREGRLGSSLKVRYAERMRRRAEETAALEGKVAENASQAA